MTRRQEQDTAAAVARLEAEYPGWVIQYFVEAELPWEARRMPFQLPASGGFTWMNAPTPERLGELIGGALQVEAQILAEEAALSRLRALRERFLAAGFTAELDAGELTVIAPVGDGPRLSDAVTCRPHLDDDGHLWFFNWRGKPIVEADNVTDAVVAIGGELRRVRRDA
ncbi:hypothetical protein [Actinomadura bangladeshensis]|uniref:Uncharacterized protein n=1 Tax=Actinomadura bangladeshensis TaxID=453573 RepID=A0A6L9QAT7_9ACTN|nr:hypothetical protein [Actinomadura bangladeshensis]NEA22609.1 hypothetical protein [Actinomadura bangladeshensis]NED55596.1 hypothetical protein [Micromonospora aurantiaca]